MTSFAPQSLTGETVEWHEVQLAFAVVVAWKKGTRLLTPFWCSSCRGGAHRHPKRRGETRVPHKTPEETTCCADGLARRFGARYRGMRLSRSSDRGKTVGFALGSLASGTLSLAATKRFQKSSPVRFPPHSRQLERRKQNVAQPAPHTFLLDHALSCGAGRRRTADLV